MLGANLPAVVRAAVLGFESYDALIAAVSRGRGEGELVTLARAPFRDGEWLVARIHLGDRSADIAARALDCDTELRLAFSPRDWARVEAFAEECRHASGVSPISGVQVGSLRPPAETRILIVDDDSDVQNVLEALLRSAGFTPSGVASAEEAFDWLRARPANALVLDWNLPGMSGIEFCKRLRRDRAMGGVPVLFLTARSSVGDVTEALSAGGNDFVSKPFRAPELQARLFGLLRVPDLITV